MGAAAAKRGSVDTSRALTWTVRWKLNLIVNASYLIYCTFI